MGEHGGKRENAGRKTKAEELGLAALIDSVWSIPKQKKVLKLLAEDAESLDFNQRHEARKLLLAYKFGKPTEKHELTGKDGGAIVSEHRIIKPKSNDSNETT